MEKGYYLVKHQGEYTIAKYHPNIPNPWSLIGYTACFKDSDFEYINQKAINMSKLKFSDGEEFDLSGPLRVELRAASS